MSLELLFLPPANEVWGKIMFLHLCVILFTVGGGGEVSVPACTTGHMKNGGLCPGGLCPRGLCPWGYLGGLCPWGSLSRGYLSRGSLSRGPLSAESLSRGPLSGESLSRGSLSRGVASVQGRVSVWTPRQRPPIQ